MAEMAEATGQCYDMRLLTQWSADHVWGMCCQGAGKASWTRGGRHHRASRAAPPGPLS